MIKKTLTTLKQHAVTLIIFCIILCGYQYATSYEMVEQIFNAFGITQKLGVEASILSEAIVLAVSAVTLLIYYLLLLMPVVYYLYEAVSNDTRKGWYKRAIKTSMLKYFLLVAIFFIVLPGLTIVVTTFIISIMADTDWDASQFSRVWDWAYLLIGIFKLYMYVVIPPIIAEKKLKDGFKNVFKTGYKYLLFSVIAYGLLWLSTEWLPFDNTLLTILSFMVITIGEILFFTFTMNLYLSETQKREVKAIEENIQGSKLND